MYPVTYLLVFEFPLTLNKTRKISEGYPFRILNFLYLTAFSVRFSAAALFEQRTQNSEVFLFASHFSLHSTTFIQEQQNFLFRPA